MILFNIRSVNSLCVNCFNKVLNCMYLSFFGFNVWYVSLFIFTIHALLLELFNDLCSICSYSSYAVNETCWLLFSKYF